MQNKRSILPLRKASESGRVFSYHVPAPLTPLIGREHEVAALCGLLLRSEVRLLTLTGTGGVGKTRLGLEVARSLQEDFADGACLVPLAQLRDPTHVLAAIAQALGLWEVGDFPLEEQVHTALRERHLLLLLDNFEHLLSAAPQLVSLLACCPGLSLLVTSRAALHLSAEQEFPVPPLALPDLLHLPEPQALAQVGAVRLLVLRMRANQPTFELTSANAATIAAICVRLDGLPLAIELAAARSKLFPPQALLKRLSHRLEVLTEGPHDLPSRQQTLRNTLQWSYDLLSREEQHLFRWLAIFVGGCTLEAAEAVCQQGHDQIANVLGGVASLIDKSLVQQIAHEGEEPRLLLLETVREFGLDSLQRQGELEVASRAHARYYLALGEAAEPHLSDCEQLLWFDRLERDLDNLRAIFQSAMTGGEEEVELALRLASALLLFWVGRGYLREGRDVLERLLAGGRPIAAPIRLKALTAVGVIMMSQDDAHGLEPVANEALALAREQGNHLHLTQAMALRGIAIMLDRRDYAAAQACLQEALTEARALRDRLILTWTLVNLGRLALYQRDALRAIVCFEEGLTLCRAMGDKVLRSVVLFQLARAELSLGHAARARNVLEEGLTISREIGSSWGIALVKSLLGWLAIQQGELSKAEALLTDGAQLASEVGDRRHVVRSRLLLAGLELLRGEYAGARLRYEESLALALDLRYTSLIASGLKGLGCVAVAQGLFPWAALLWGVAEPLGESRSMLIPPQIYDRMVAVVGSQLGGPVFEEVRAKGRAMTPAQVLASSEAFPPQAPQPAKETPRSAPTAPPSPSPHPSSLVGLTVREVEVLGLLAQGLTNPQIAERLVVSLPTVNKHVASIFNKLGVNSRSAATRTALEQHLI